MVQGLERGPHSQVPHGERSAGEAACTHRYGLLLDQCHLGPIVLLVVSFVRLSVKRKFCEFPLLIIKRKAF
jgi:hypothetical protein